MPKLDQLMESIKKYVGYDKWIGKYGIGTTRAHRDYSILSPDDATVGGIVVGGLMEGLLYSGALFALTGNEYSAAIFLPVLLFRYARVRSARKNVKTRLESLSGTALDDENVRYYPKTRQYQVDGKLYSV